MLKIQLTSKPFTKTIILSFIVVCCFAIPNGLYANGLKKIAILPFEVHSQKDITHIQNGLEIMLSSRLSWENHTKIIDKNTVSNALEKNNKLSKNKFLPAVAATTGSDYVLTGSITEFADSFSIDANIYNIQEQTSLPFFGQADQIEKIIPEISLLAAKINKKVFDRTTERYEEFTEEQSYAKQRQQQQRMDPEKMVTPKRLDHEVDHRPWWQVWKYF